MSYVTFTTNIWPTINTVAFWFWFPGNISAHSGNKSVRCQFCWKTSWRKEPVVTLEGTTEIPDSHLFSRFLNGWHEYGQTLICISVLTIMKSFGQVPVLEVQASAVIGWTPRSIKDIWEGKTDKNIASKESTEQQCKCECFNDGRGSEVRLGISTLYLERSSV